MADTVTGLDRWLLRRFGRRGLYLLYLAFLDAVYGASLLLPGQKSLSLAAYSLLLPQQAWGGVWLGCGLVAAVYAPRRLDRVAFAVQSALLAGWAVLYAQLLLVQHDTHAWVSVAVWLAMAVTVQLIAGWPEPPVLLRPPDPVVITETGKEGR